MCDVSLHISGITPRSFQTLVWLIPDEHWLSTSSLLKLSYPKLGGRVT